MRRAVLTVVGTAAGLAALLSFKTHSAASIDAAAPAPSTPPSAMAAAPSGNAAAGASAAGASGKKPGTAATQARTVTGAVANTEHGPMQVQLTMMGTKITKATVVQRTNDGAESVQIDSFSIPKLESETLAAQGASIDAVSGASYTSQGYIQSLQSAVDKSKA